MIIGNCTIPAFLQASRLIGMSEAPKVTVLFADLLDAAAGEPID